MAYQTGAASSPKDLLQKIQAFLAANGWTIDAGADDGSGYRLHAHRGAVYANFRAAVAESTTTTAFALTPSGVTWNGIALYLGDGYDSLKNWRDQPGGPLGYGTTYNNGCAMVMASGAIVAYHFFASQTGDDIFIIAEKTSGIFTHLGFGCSIEKSGTFTGGPYFYGATPIYDLTRSNSQPYPGFALNAFCPGWAYRLTTNDPHVTVYIRADVDTFTGKWIGNTYTTDNYFGYTGRTGGTVNSFSSLGSDSITAYGPSLYYHMSRAFSSISNQAILLPIHSLVARDGGGLSFVGTLPGVFATNACQRGLAPASEYLWGSETYMVFPGPSSHPFNGYAIRKVV